MAFSALLDACVLIPGALRDVLLEIGTSSAYRPLWSERIEEEVARAVVRIRDAHGLDSQDSETYVKRSLRQMNIALPDARVNDWKDLENRLPEGPDPKDRHVVAAAIVGRADVIVTFNLKDFPDQTLPGDLFVQHPDEFLRDLLDLNPLIERSPRIDRSRRPRSAPTEAKRTRADAAESPALD